MKSMYRSIVVPKIISYGSKKIMLNLTSRIWRGLGADRYLGSLLPEADSFQSNTGSKLFGKLMNLPKDGFESVIWVRLIRRKFVLLKASWEYRTAHIVPGGNRGSKGFK